MRQNRNTSVRNGDHGRVLIVVRQVLAHVLDHQPLRIVLEVRVDEAGQVEVGAAVEVQLVLEHLVHGVAGGAVRRDLVLGDVALAGVGGREGGQVLRGLAAGRAGAVAGEAQVLQVLDYVFGVDLGFC